MFKEERDYTTFAWKDLGDMEIFSTLIKPDDLRQSDARTEIRSTHDYHQH